MLCHLKDKKVFFLELPLRFRRTQVTNAAFWSCSINWLKMWFGILTHVFFIVEKQLQTKSQPKKSMPERNRGDSAHIKILLVYFQSIRTGSIYRRRNESIARENAVGLTKTGLFLKRKFKIRS